MNYQSISNYSIDQYEKMVIDSYSFHCYIVSIVKVPQTKEFEYQVQYNPLTYNHLKNFSRYEKEIKIYLKEFVLGQKDFCTFNQLYNYLSADISSHLELPEQLLIPVLLRALDLEKIGSVLIDDQIDEIYLDSSKKNLYIDHSRHGRCTTSIKLKKEEIESFIYRVALENDFSLNKSNPTMKSDFVSSLFHTRVTVDIPPLIIEDFHIDIRKFRSQKLRISDLVNNGSITLNQAILLVFLIQNQVSISIIGPPNSGKTTLQNALIEYIPPHFRLLSVEDVLETTETRQGNTVRFRLGYDPQEKMVFSKSLEIQKILHRSPDFINLGELSTKDNFTAFLNVLSVGIPSIQTIHGRNPEYLFIRLKDIYEIPLGLLKTSFPHVFIELNVSWIKNVKKRTIMRIAELTKEGKIETLSEKNIESFLSYPSSESGIFTLDSLIVNQIDINDVIDNLKGITIDLGQEASSEI
ncbi:MAG: type II/IV secretion system ATPase subunit [Candidatus Heimdallarchaeota archaeon]|nr:MAG: type II/IV secretion system ATPase subunit [Candidatus Heimdallarchaeota archaeon]